MKYSEPKLAKCDRCQRYVFECYVSGVRTTVDTAPLDVNRYRAWLIAKLATYDLKKNQAGMPSKLLPRSGVSGWGKYEVLGQHPCSVKPVTNTEVELIAPPKVTAPVSFSSAKKVFVRDSSKARRGYRARDAIRPLSRPARCDVCRKRVYVSDPDVVSIECGPYLWAVHEECP